MNRSLLLGLLLMVGVGARIWAEEPFDYFTNSWSLIGLKDYLDATRVTPENELLLADGRRLRMSYGKHPTPLGRRPTKTLLGGWLPIVLLSAEQDGVRYDFRFWATPLPTVEDWRAAYDGPTEGENYLNWVRIGATNVSDTSKEANARVERLGAADATSREFAWTLAPGERAETVVRELNVPVDGGSFQDADADTWHTRTEHFWRERLSKGADFEIPDERANNALRASHVYQFINNDHGIVQGGEGFYDIFYIRDGAYEVLQFEEAGFLDTARKGVEAYLATQRPDGRFETQKDQFDANGQAIWTLWQFYLISGDHQWLERAYPAMARSVEWIIKARRRMPEDSPFAGVLPNALADGENLWNGQYHIVGYDFWNLRAVLCTAAAARALGNTGDAERFSKEADAYRLAIDAMWKNTGLAHFPPSWEKAGTHWGNTETLWPTPLFSRDDPRVAALITEVRENFGGGFHEGTIRWSPGTSRDAIHPYMSSYTTMASLARDRHEQVAEDFYWYLLHSTSAHAFPEGIFYRQRFAWSDTIPHATGASNYAFLLRHMLLHEQGDELHLLKAVPDWWLGEGQTIRIERAPTHFGEVTLKAVGTKDGVRVDWESPQRRLPRRVVLYLPKSRPPLAVPARVEVVLRPDQTRRWDLAAVLEQYERIKPKPISGFLTLPLDQSPTPQQCRMLDLQRWTNTNPFTAPFGVPRPGKFLFTGLGVGLQLAAGVPFQILDPAKNDGLGLVVLQGGPEGGAAASFPREVSIPVGASGKRIFFLGSVVGWSGGDSGTGELGAVAEYVIQYEDGREQRLPWVPGRTTDDWAVRPLADQVLVGLRGDPWHLNVTGATLHSAPIETIIFRDLGTVSAPVLVAVTVEQ